MKVTNVHHGRWAARIGPFFVEIEDESEPGGNGDPGVERYAFRICPDNDKSEERALVSGYSSSRALAESDAIIAGHAIVAAMLADMNVEVGGIPSDVKIGDMIDAVHAVLNAAKVWCDLPGPHECGYVPIDDDEAARVLCDTVVDLRALEAASR